MLGIIHTITELSTQRNKEALSGNSYPCISQATVSCVSDPQSASGLTTLTLFFVFRVCLEALAPKVAWVLR